MFGDFNIGWDYAWWFPAIYALITGIFIVIFGKGFIKKFFRFPGGKFKWKIPTLLSSTLFSRGILAYAIFLPLKIDTIWIWIGTVIFGISTILYGIATYDFASTTTDQPVVKGLYKLSRHPIQVLAIIMSIGIGIATTSWIIIVASLVLTVASYPTFVIQERACVEAYGKPYSEYINRTSRWLGLTKQD